MCWSWLGFRGEIRDVHTGARRFSIPTPGPPVQNVVASAVYRWSFDPALSEGLFLIDMAQTIPLGIKDSTPGIITTERTIP